MSALLDIVVIARIGLVVGLLIYLWSSRLIGARLSLGGLAPERFGDEAGLEDELEPGTRSWLSLETLRHASYGGIVFSAAVAGLPGGLVTAAATALITLLLGRVFESLLGPRRPAIVLRRHARVLRFIDAVASPILGPLSSAHQRLAARDRLAQAGGEDELLDEQLEDFIRDSEEEGLLEREQSELLREIVDAGDVEVSAVMTARGEISAVQVDAEEEELTQLFATSRRSRLPVYEDTLDNIVGVVSVRDLLTHIHERASGLTAQALMRPIQLVPRTMAVLELLRELQRSQQHMAIVLDDLGGTAGLVTLEDLLEEIVGEIHDEHEIANREIQPDGHGGLLVDGMTTLEDLEPYVGSDLGDGRVETVAGLVFSGVGRVPRVGDRVPVNGEWEAEVIRMAGRRVVSVRLRHERPTDPGRAERAEPTDQVG